MDYIFWLYLLPMLLSLFYAACLSFSGGTGKQIGMAITFSVVPAYNIFLTFMFFLAIVVGVYRGIKGR